MLRISNRFVSIQNVVCKFRPAVAAIRKTRTFFFLNLPKNKNPNFVNRTSLSVTIWVNKMILGKIFFFKKDDPGDLLINLDYFIVGY